MDDQQYHSSLKWKQNLSEISFNKPNYNQMNCLIKRIFIASVSFVIASCGETALPPNEKPIIFDTTKQILDTAKLSPDSTDRDSTAVTRKSTVKVYWYFTSMNDTGESGPSERRKLSAGSDVWCYDFMDFEKLTLEGDAEGIVLTVKRDGKMVFQVGPFDLNGKKTFKESQLHLGGGAEIEVTQDVKSVFKTSVRSKGCT